MPEDSSHINRIRLESLVSPQEQTGSDEQQFFTSLRPKRLSEYVGQRVVVENLEVSLEAAKGRGEALDHILFHGPPGLGKTTLAHIIAQEMGRELIQTSGPALERPGDLMGTLTKLKAGDVLFIDEIHRLPRIVEEFLYPAMEDFSVDFILDKGPHSRTVKFKLQPFTLIGATTRAGLLTAPLRERFGIFHHLEFYSVEDLERIVTRSASLLEVEVETAGAKEIARRSRGTPRIANRLLRRVRDYAQVKAGGVITSKVADDALSMLRVDMMGLDELDRKVLTVVIDHYAGGPVGINAIAATLQEEEDTLIDVVEPFLMKIGFLNRTQRGRCATRAACLHLGKPPVAISDDSQSNLSLE